MWRFEPIQDHRSARAAASWALGLLAAASCACQRPEGEVFPAVVPPIVWPAAPEQPRVEWVGAISGSSDLKAGKSGMEVFKDALRGSRPPLVFTSPHGVAVTSDGLVAVADGSGAAVHIIDLSARTHLVTLGDAARRFAAPLGVAWAGRRLFVTDAELHEVVELDGGGGVRKRFGTDELVRPVGIAYIAPRQQLYVVDGGAHTICVYDLHGRRVRCLGQRGSEPGSFNYPTHIGYDAAARLAVADTGNFRVQLLDLDGAPLGVLGHKGDAAGDMALPKGVAFDSAGHLYVVDAQFEAVQLFDGQGRLLLAIGAEGSGPGEFSLPAGLAIDALDRIWVADSANRRLQVFQYRRSGTEVPAGSLSMELGG